LCKFVHWPEAVRGFLRGGREMKVTRLLAAALLLVPTLLLAQAQGRIEGFVHDSKGNPITDATIKLTCPELPTFEKELKTDERGEFATLIVDATKKYLFHVEAPGFQPIEQLNKPKIGGQTLHLDFELKSLQEAESQAEQQALEQPGVKELREARDLLDRGKKPEARAKLEAAVKAKPDLYLAWMELGRLDLEDGKNADALEDAKKCLALSANFAPCLAVAVNASQALGDTKAFESYMAAYKQANPSDPAVLFNEAVEHLNNGEDDAAKPLLEEALQADPNFGDALFQLGMIYVRKGDNAKARDYLERFIKAAPDNKDVPTAKEMLKYLQ
jgi:tetratricopeptide (TPR) repeat protein